MPLFRFASAASRESSVQAANKQKQSDAYRAAVMSVRRPLNESREKVHSIDK